MSILHFSKDSQQHRQRITQAKKIVIKVGTHVLVDQTGKPNHSSIINLVENLAKLRQKNKEVVLVTSGAIGAGMEALGMKRTPTTPLTDLQMAAAVGQSRLMELYHKYFSEHHCLVSQILLTHDDLKHRMRHLNARNTLLNLLRHHVIPIINENDVVSVDEIRLGDNDVLSALVTVLIDADLLILLTTPNGLQRFLPNGEQQRISYLPEINNSVLQLAKGKSSHLSTGGMITKLKAAQIATQIGAQVIIASGFQKNVIEQILHGEDVGTLICQEKNNSLNGRKRWIAFFHRPQGIIIIDEGAEIALQHKGKSLLPIGIHKVEGQFTAGALVDVVNKQGIKIAQGLVSYSSTEIKKIQGKPAVEIHNILGIQGHAEIIHRDNCVLVDEK